MQPRLRVLRPYPHIWAFYAGRDPRDQWSDQPNWVDRGALSLGIASYAIVDGDAALIYDTHVSVAQADVIRETLEAAGVTDFTVVLSHHHLDHVAGSQAFGDCTIIANARTAAHLARDKMAIEAGRLSGPPAIRPLILPTHTFETKVHIHIGGLHIDLIRFNIHSDDATVIWLGHDGILLAGDTLEDSLTYVAEPEGLEDHLTELDRLAALKPRHILPNHGAPEVIAAGGYGPGMIGATQGYIRDLLAAREDATLREKPVQDWIAPAVASGALTWFAPYSEVHRANLEKVLKATG